MRKVLVTTIREEIQAVIDRNREFIRDCKGKGAPLPTLAEALANSLIRYDVTDLDVLQTIPALLATGAAADIDELVAWRVAELQEQGEAARFEVIAICKTDETPEPISLVVVRGNGRIEEPTPPPPEPHALEARCERRPSGNFLIVSCEHVVVECPLVSLDPLKWIPNCDANHAAATLLTWLDEGQETREVMRVERAEAMRTDPRVELELPWEVPPDGPVEREITVDAITLRVGALWTPENFPKQILAVAVSPRYEQEVEVVIDTLGNGPTWHFSKTTLDRGDLMRVTLDGEPVPFVWRRCKGNWAT